MVPKGGILIKFFIFSALTLLVGCEPEYSLYWTKRFSRSIDTRCVETALRSLDPNLTKSEYVSDGARGFPSGTSVTQLGYKDPRHLGYYNVDVAILADGSMQYYHGWDKMGNRPDERALAAINDVLRKNNQIISIRCNLEFSESDFRYRIT